MTSNRLHPLAAIILGPLGALLVDCGTTADGCPETTSRTETFGDGCTLELTSKQEAGEECFTIELAPGGACPAFDDDGFETARQEGEVYDSVRCGPMRPAGPPVDGERVATAVGAGGGGDAGGADDGGPIGAGASGGGDASGGTNAGGAGGATTSSVSTGSGASETTLGSCCYIVVTGSYCIGGRPFLVEGAPRVAPTALRRDWSASSVTAPGDARLSESERAAIAAAWLKDAAYEHASVAAFARFTLELLAVGAPAELVEAAQQAGLDEIRHARLCYGLAERFGAGKALGPGALEIAGVGIASTLEEMIDGVIREGCVGETIAALIASRALEHATAPGVREVLSVIAEDEARHASLAWRFVAWAVRVGGDAVGEIARAEIERALAGAPMDGEVSDGANGDVLRAHGRLGAEERRAVALEALREVVEPCAERVLASVVLDRVESRPAP